MKHLLHRLRRSLPCLGLLPLGLFAVGPSMAHDKPGILILGDSLSAAYGIDAEKGWVALLSRRLRQAGLDYRVINASISGDTTRGGLSRLDQALGRAEPVAICIVELGANDGLRGLPLRAMSRNLAAIIERCRTAGADVLLVGMRIPPNYGHTYTDGFVEVYSNLARDYELPLVPFFLDRVVQRREWMQEDGLHPRAEAQPRLLENVWPKLEPLLVPPTDGSKAPHTEARRHEGTKARRHEVRNFRKDRTL